MKEEKMSIIWYMLNDKNGFIQKYIKNKPNKGVTIKLYSSTDEGKEFIKQVKDEIKKYVLQEYNGDVDLYMENEMSSEEIKKYKPSYWFRKEEYERIMNYYEHQINTLNRQREFVLYTGRRGMTHYQSLFNQQANIVEI